MGSVLVLAGCCSAVACGSGAPLHHPAHPLAAEQLSLGAGLSYERLQGELATEVDQARIDDASLDSAGLSPGALGYRATTPGMAPWVAARVGLGQGNEGGLTYTARSVRADVRHALVWDAWALSLELGAHALIARPTGYSSELRVGSVETGNSGGVGVDLPAIIGWRSAGDVVQWWAGPRIGVERLQGLFGSQDTDAGLEAASWDVQAYHWQAGALLGVSLGMQPISVALEFGAGLHFIHGRVEPRGEPAAGASSRAQSVDLSGFAWSPSGAVIWEF